jgi:hypothetical protein
MSWLFSVALLPFVLCGAMCLGGALLAALGLRRGAKDRRDAPRDEPQGASSKAKADR